MAETKTKFGNFSGGQNADVIVSLGIICILILMVMPLPPIMIDIFLALSFASSTLLLLMAIYTKKALDFSVFPSLLLMTTLFRLSLNVASTRLVLLHGADSGIEAAGNIIRAFGEFVVGG